MTHERNLGHTPIDVSAQKEGWDIESRDGAGGPLRLIEVKGRHALPVPASLIKVGRCQPSNTAWTGWASKPRHEIAFGRTSLILMPRRHRRRGCA